MLTVPESCPKIALKCEKGFLGMKWRIWTEKILLNIEAKLRHTLQTGVRGELADQG